MEGPDALMRLRESQKAAARAGSQARKSRLYTSPGEYSPRVCAGGVVGRHPVRYRRLLYRAAAGGPTALGGWPRIAQVRPAGRLRAGLEAFYG